MQNLADVNADLQPLSQLALTAPLTQGSLCGERKPTTPQSATPPALPRHACVCERRPTTPQSATPPALPRHACVCERRPTTPQSPNGASSPYTGEPMWWVQTYSLSPATPPALPRHACVCERRPTTPQSACAASSPYTGEPIEVCIKPYSVPLHRGAYWSRCRPTKKFNTWQIKYFMVEYK